MKNSFIIRATIDVDTKEILAIYVSWQRSNLNAYIFLRKVLKVYSNKPLTLVDSDPWYPLALSKLRMASFNFWKEKCCRTLFLEYLKKDF
jgi:transposase-like protein